MARPKSPHGTASRWRVGCRCDLCRVAHSEDTTERRRVKRLALLAPHRSTILRRLAAGNTLDDACRGTNLTPHAIYGFARLSPEWRAEMDAAQRSGRSPSVAHGTAMGYKDGCRCPDCREAHHKRLIPMR